MQLTGSLLWNNLTPGPQKKSIYMRKLKKIIQTKCNIQNMLGFQLLLLKLYTQTHKSQCFLDKCEMFVFMWLYASWLPSTLTSTFALHAEGEAGRAKFYPEWRRYGRPAHLCNRFLQRWAMGGVYRGGCWGSRHWGEGGQPGFRHPEAPRSAPAHQPQHEHKVFQRHQVVQRSSHRRFVFILLDDVKIEISSPFFFLCFHLIPSPPASPIETQARQAVSIQIRLIKTP